MTPEECRQVVDFLWYEEGAAITKNPPSYLHIQCEIMLGIYERLDKLVEALPSPITIEPAVEPEEIVAVEPDGEST